jgi:hypothetical protein
MSEQELIRALQELVARHSPPPDPRQLSAELIVRDRWRIRLLAAVTALLWLGGIAGVLYMIFCFNRFIIEYSPVNADTGRGWYTTEQFSAKMKLHHSLEACEAAVPALLLAALCTVWLVFSSRRATLNQINISLAEISEQLRQLRQSARPPGGRGGPPPVNPDDPHFQRNP